MTLHAKIEKAIEELTAPESDKVLYKGLLLSRKLSEFDSYLKSKLQSMESEDQDKESLASADYTQLLNLHALLSCYIEDYWEEND